MIRLLSSSLVILPLLFLTACSDSYRYPCQDPDNWDNKYCKKPYCSANGTCPEDLAHYLKDKDSKGNKKGTCK